MVLLQPKDSNLCTFGSAASFGMASLEVKRLAREADLLLNFHGSLPGSLTHLFRRKALIDVDPGIVQLGAQFGHFDIDHHNTFFSAGFAIPIAKFLYWERLGILFCRRCTCLYGPNKL